MEQIRELMVVFDEGDITISAEQGSWETAAPQRKKRRGLSPVAILVILALTVFGGYGTMRWGVPAVRYAGASIKMVQGDYAEARREFVKLGTFWDAADRAAEADKRCVYQEALDCLERGDRSGAKIRLTQLGVFEDSYDRIREIENTIAYEQAERYLRKKDYLAAYEAFAALGDFHDAQQKAEECHEAYTAKETERLYNEGCRLYARGRLVDAYRVLSTLPNPNHGNTATILADISATAVRLTEKYAKTGERGRALSFLRLVEEIDSEKGAELREKYFPKEELTPDESFYIFDVSHISVLTYKTTREELASVVLYMIMYGKLNLGLTSHREIDRITMVDRALQSCDLVGEIIPGHGSIYNPSVYVGDNYVSFRLNVEQEYSEFQRNQHIKLFKEFCVNSVMELTEAGVLSETMSHRQKAEVIMNWVGFYLTYDQTLHTHDVGVAVEDKRGVCEAYASLYNRMCNLVGVPTYGQIGKTLGGENTRHIWSFHVGENGDIFYADATWADPYEIDFGTENAQEPTVELFLEYYLARCMDSAMAEEQGGGNSETLSYIYSETLWSTHMPERTPEEIIAYHNQITGKGE